MKALEILKRICNHGSATIIEIKEAIKELEEFNNRSCESCKTRHCPVRIILVENEYINSNYFYCNDWEMKENK